MVVISNGKSNPRTMTTSVARKVLTWFKRIPEWHRTTFNNSIVQISPEGSEISACGQRPARPR